MPQLDKVSYFSQFFWLCFFYLGFYLSLVKFFLPKMSRILKLRQRKVEASQNLQDLPYTQESQELQQNTQDTFFNGIQQSRDALQESFQTSVDWFRQATKTTNKTQLQAANDAYIAKMTQTQTSLFQLVQNLQTLLPPTAHQACGFQSLKGQQKQHFFTAKLLHTLFQLQPKAKAQKKSNKK